MHPRRVMVVALILWLYPLSLVAQPTTEAPTPTAEQPRAVPNSSPITPGPAIGGVAEATPCTRPKPTPNQIEAFEDWKSRLRTSQGLNRWGKRVAFAGLGVITGALLGSVIGHGSITINSSSPWLYVAVGTAGVACSLDVAAYVTNPGPYHPPPPTVGARDRGARVFSVAWRF